MSTELIVGLVAGTLTVLLIIIGFSLSNTIIAGKNLVRRAWADVIAYQRKKLKLIPELEQQLRDYGAYEGKLLTGLTELRSRLGGLSEDTPDAAQLTAIEQRSKELLAGLRVTVEAYPQLRASTLYNSLMRELAEAEENIAAALVIFNAMVQDFNDRIQQVPGRWINRWFNKERPVAEFADPAATAEFDYRPNL